MSQPIGGQGSGFASFGTVNTANSTDITDNQQYVTGGPLNAQTSASAAVLSAGSGSTLNVTQESPGALALANSAITQAANTQQLAQGLLASVAQSGTLAEQTLAQSALDAAKNALQTNAQAAVKDFGKIITVLAVTGTVALLIYYMVKK